MSRYFYTLNSKDDRIRAVNTIAAAPVGARVEIKAEKRSLPQNNRMWAMLTDIAHQLPWHGQKLRPDDWKLLFLDALKRETKAIPNLDGSGVVSIGTSSSDLSKSEMSDMIELMLAFGAEHSVTFHDRAEAA
jgi:NinB protein